MNDRSRQAVPPSRADASREGADAERDEVHALVQRTLAGDDDAYAEIFRRYRGKVHRICFRFTRDADEAMDLLQTVFIKAHRSLASYREEASFATWISRVATNCGIDHVRAKKREAKVELDDAALEESTAAELVMSRPQSPGAALEGQELGRAIHEAVDALSEKHRTVFVLHCVEGMPYQAIADTLEISIGTVMSRLFHARRYLRKSLAPYLGDAQVRTLLRHEGGRPPEMERA